MATWAEMEAEVPALARLGRKLLVEKGRGYLATTRADGGPRVQAICPVVRSGRLYAGIIKATPKHADLLRDRRFALHAPLAEGDAEFWITGAAQLLSGAETTRMTAANPSWEMPVANSLFHLDIGVAYGTIFHPGENNVPIPDRRIFRGEA
jgi:hypothetical protein